MTFGNNMAGKIRVTQVLYKQVLFYSFQTHARLYSQLPIVKLSNTGSGIIGTWSSPVLQPIPRTGKCIRACFSSKKGKSKKESIKTDSVDVDKDLASAAVSVASSLPGDQAKTESDLLQQLRFHAKLTKTQSRPGQDNDTNESLSDTLSGMKISKTREDHGMPVKETAVKGRQGRQRRPSSSFTERIDVKLFQGPGLGIFSPKPDDKNVVAEVPDKTCSLWDVVLQEELEQLTTLPPSNDFEEMIKLTKEGKMWKFPIDNEQGWEDEKRVGFHEHIFLENLLVDFPKKGPIRHFMELVITGLSKNPHVTAQQKRDHIHWFEEYFREKQNILEETLGEKLEGHAAQSST